MVAEAVDCRFGWSAKETSELNTGIFAFKSPKVPDIMSLGLWGTTPMGGWVVGCVPAPCCCCSLGENAVASMKFSEPEAVGPGLFDVSAL